jgi:ketosteroid isomerase-like protein
LTIHEYGDFAIMAGPFHAKLWPEDGSDMREVLANATGVWRRTEASWEILSFQVTKTQP